MYDPWDKAEREEIDELNGARIYEIPYPIWSKLADICRSTYGSIDTIKYGINGAGGTWFEVYSDDRLIDSLPIEAWLVLLSDKDFPAHYEVIKIVEKSIVEEEQKIESFKHTLKKIR